MNIPSVLTLQDNSFQLSRMRPSQVAHVSVPANVQSHRRPPSSRWRGRQRQLSGVQLNLAIVTDRLLFDRFYAVAFGIKHTHQAPGGMVVIFLFEIEIDVITLCCEVKGDFGFFQVRIG